MGTVDEDSLVENHRVYCEAELLVCKKCGKVAIAFARRNFKEEEE